MGKPTREFGEKTCHTCNEIKEEKRNIKSVTSQQMFCESPSLLQAVTEVSFSFYPYSQQIIFWGLILIHSLSQDYFFLHKIRIRVPSPLNNIPFCGLGTCLKIRCKIMFEVKIILLTNQNYYFCVYFIFIYQIYIETHTIIANQTCTSLVTTRLPFKFFM